MHGLLRRYRAAVGNPAWEIAIISRCHSVPLFGLPKMAEPMPYH
ncbi:hypothetical protein N9M10_02865 [Hellea sp.]|nr:hypothetical protein [Hellea sp.]